jgi:hypothetical protein
MTDLASPWTYVYDLFLTPRLIPEKADFRPALASSSCRVRSDER